ncbi:hypothetical protein NDU88_005281 [Pleurodeles waltl]|uniref:Uncharacterized protein n=1 Tax=Pleurodeles waltl TaxID=8319 RepID=A0AAV7NM15_PLEWA|nr:hypothetical protein NDU88_005281 [Pleurodeles waltl]
MAPDLTRPHPEPRSKACASRGRHQLHLIIDAPRHPALPWPLTSRGPTQSPAAQRVPALAASDYWFNYSLIGSNRAVIFTALAHTTIRVAGIRTIGAHTE